MPSDIVGFRNGQIIYPISFVASIGSIGEEGLRMFSSIPLEPILSYMPGEHSDMVMEFDLAGNTEKVSITKEDIEHLAWIRDKCGLNYTTQSDLRDIFDSQEGTIDVDGYVSKDAFDACMRILVPSESLSPSEQVELSVALNRIFVAFDRHSENKILAKEFISAFGALASGAGSESKLSFAFSLFDENGDGLLTPVEIVAFLRSFLTLILSLNDHIADLPSTYVHDLINTTAEHVVHRLFKEADANHDGALTWQEFSEWHKSQGGSSLLPWIQILSVDTHDSLIRRHRPRRLSDPDQVLSNFPSDEKDDDPTADYADNPTSPSEDHVIFEFPLAPGHGNLSVSVWDVNGLDFLLKRSKINEMDTNKIISIFYNNSEEVDDGTKIISKSAYDSIIRSIVPHSVSLTSDERYRLSLMFSNIFFAFDRDHTKDALADELVSGFLLLCKGSKSYKLSLAFSLFDTEQTGTLSVADFSRFIRSFLTVIAALNGDMSSYSVDKIYEIIDDTVVHITNEVNEDESDTVSFDEFGSFYNTKGGHMVCGWIELLDLSKWPFNSASGSSPSQTTSPSAVNHRRRFSTVSSHIDALNGHLSAQNTSALPSKAVAAATGSAKAEETPVFRFSLYDSEFMDNSKIPGSDGSASGLMATLPFVLEVHNADVNNLGKILMSTDLDDIPVKDLFHELSLVSNHGSISKQDFDKCARKLIPSEYLSDDDKGFLSQVLSNIFFAYDREGSGKVRFKEFASGFSLFCSGSKSEKLSAAWGLFDTDSDGMLSREQLARYLRAFLTILFALTESAGECEAKDIWTVVDESALAFSERIFHTTGKDDSIAISFDEFAKWYTSGGYERASWLELLDLSKWKLGDENGRWVKGRSSSTSNTFPPGKKSSSKPKSAPSLSNDKEKSKVVFEFSLSKDGSKQLLILKSDIENLEKIAKSSRLYKMNAEKVLTAFVQDAKLKVTGKATKQEFDSIIRKLIPGAMLTDQERVFLSGALSSIFHSYDREITGTVDIVELAIGVSLLADGNKSDKLSLAFGMFDERTGEGSTLTRNELLRFLRSFLTVIHALIESCTHTPANIIWQTIDATAIEVAASVFLQAKRKKKDVVSFVEFADWYTEGGYQQAAWLELLSLRKWGITFDDANLEDDQYIEEEDDGDDEQEEDEDVIFDFTLTDDGENALVVRADDVENIDHLVRLSQIASMSPEELQETIVNEASGFPTMTKESFEKCILKLIAPKDKKTAFSASEMKFVVERTNLVFKSLIETSDKKAKEKSTSAMVEDIICAMLVLCNGSKSDKIGFAWSLFSGNGKLVRGYLRRILRAFLIVLLALNHEVRDGKTIHSIAETAASQVVRIIFETSTRADETYITLEEFAQWWTDDAGFEDLPWLELLNLKKWSLSNERSDKPQEPNSPSRL